MNWKIRFRELTGWRPKNEPRTVNNDEERWRISTKSLMETSQKHYGSASASISFHGNNFSHKFRVIPQYQKGSTHLLFPPSPIYRRKGEGGCRPACPAELGCFHQKPSPIFGRFRKAQVGQITIYTPYLLNIPSLCFFLSISFWNVAELYGLHNDTYFPSETSQNSMDYATTHVLTSGKLRNFTDYATMLVLTFGMLWNFTDYATMLVLTSGISWNFTDYATILVLRVPKGENKVWKSIASTPKRN